MKCEYLNCNKRAIVHLHTVDMHYCREHLREVAGIFELFRQHKRKDLRRR
jgi:hypothetical protein